MSVAIKHFYVSANAIFCHSKYVFEYVKLRLLESFVLALLTYSLEAINLPTAQMRQLNVCWNNVYRKIFNMHQWESVKDIQFYSGRLDLVHMLSGVATLGQLRAVPRLNFILPDCVCPDCVRN